MKKHLIYLTLTVLLLSGCDVLDVSSRFETKETDLYKTEEGFKSALTGVYIKIAHEDLYGKYASMVIPEYITRHWELKSNVELTAMEYGLYTHDYTVTKTEDRIKKLWEKYYNAIVQVNNVIENIENTDVYFSHGNDKLIKGEAYGLRAFLHLDLLRFFGPVPKRATDGTAAIPYLEEVTRDPNLMLTKTWGEVKSKILRDLTTAEGYLANDPYTMGNYADLNYMASAVYVPAEEWQAYRQTRMNIYAVKAMKARAYLWFGDTDNAVKYAKEVIEEENRDGTPKFALADENYLTGNARFYRKTLVLDSECIFQVENSKHQDVLKNVFNGSSQELMNEDIETLFESGANPNDIRVQTGRYWGNETINTVMRVVYYKYIGNTDTNPVNRIPVIRLSEMYLILAECLPVAEANKYFELYRIERKLLRNYTTNPFDESERMGIIESEYRKDFFAEGQMFAFYKRLNYSTFNYPWVEDVDEKVYVLPTPKGQIEFE